MARMKASKKRTNRKRRTGRRARGITTRKMSRKRTHRKRYSRKRKKGGMIPAAAAVGLQRNPVVAADQLHTGDAPEAAGDPLADMASDPETRPTYIGVVKGIGSLKDELHRSLIDHVKRLRMLSSNWVPDEKRDSCVACNASFDSNRHHCRACGEIFCDPCSSNTIEDNRVCDLCNFLITNPLRL